MKKALITGVTGQDGSYLAELLISKGYEVHGIIRRSSSFNTDRVEGLYQQAQQGTVPFYLHYGDLTDGSALNRLLEKIVPNEIYNLGAQSHVKVSFDNPEYTADVVGMGTLRLLDAIKDTGIKTRFYQASSSEMYGLVQAVPQNESTPFYPRSPYAAAKVFAYWMTVNYRESYNLYACNGILFNHESPRRGKTFVTSKIVDSLVAYKYHNGPALRLGNLDAKRDWGYAGDYVDAMWRMLQQDNPKDYVIATGETHSVREFLEKTLAMLDIAAVPNGKTGLDEQYVCPKGKSVVMIDQRYFRPAEVDLLLGDASLALADLGWRPQMSFDGLIRLMVDAAIQEQSRASR